MKKFLAFTGIIFLILNTLFSQEIKFGVITDVHHGFLTDVNKRLQVFIDTCTAEEVDFIIQMGDFSLAMNDANTGSFLNIWNSFDGPKFHVLGNHDMDKNSKESVRNYLGMESNYYSFDMKGVHFVIMDGNFIKRGDGDFIDYDHGNYFSMDRDWHGDDQLQWFKQDLANTDLPTVRFSHLHRQAKDRVAVEKIISDANNEAGFKKVCLCLNGHGHKDVEEIIDGVPYLEIPTASHKWNGAEERAEPYTTVRFAIVTINTKNGTVIVDGYSEEVDYQDGLPIHEGTITDRLYTFSPSEVKAYFMYSISSCDATVSFSDKSEGRADSWLWDFGDGHSSMERDPEHIYTSSGSYTVTLVVGNVESSDTISRQVSVSTGLPVPMVVNGSRCGKGVVSLSATADHMIYWYDASSGGSKVAEGDTLITPFLSETKTYYVATVIPGDSITEFGSKTDKGVGEYYKWDDADASWGLQFNASTDFILRSVKVYNGTSTSGSYTGERTFTVIDSSGTEIAAATVNILNGEQRLDLNMSIPAGNGYSLISDRHVGLWKDTQGASYPYAIGTDISVTGGVRYDGIPGPAGTYYFFYDWEIELSDDLSSCRRAVDAIINPLPRSQFSHEVNNKVVSFTNQSTGDHYLWNFGDGTILSEEENPVHEYPDFDSYLVKLVSFNSCGADSSEKYVSLADTVSPEYVFLNYDFIGEGYGFTATNPSDEPWVPRVTIDKSKIIWVSPDGGGDGRSEALPTTFQNALSSVGEGYTILALDGLYSIEIAVDELVHVNVISKNKYGAVIEPQGDNGDDAAFRFANKCNVHHVNFIGFEVTNGRSFIFNPGTLVEGYAYNIYISDMKFHDLTLALYSGLHSYNWTVDRCLFYDSRASYLWYMMGFHQTVMNSIMYNNTYLSLAIRGHYPLDEFYNWQGGNTFVKDREEGYLEPEDWTHKIINNTFGSNYNTTRLHRGHLGLFYNIIPEEEANGDGEACYLPPQNVVVANNVFVDDGPKKKYGFDIWASRGINTGAVDAVNGIFINNNVTSKSTLVVAGDGTDISDVEHTGGNITGSSNIAFKDELVRDYRLTISSTDLIDGGADGVYSPNNDFSGRKREGIADIGAYEYDETVGVEYLLNDIGITLFPNPATDVFYILIDDCYASEKMSLTLFNSLSQQVRIVSGLSPGKTEIDIRGLNRGIYFCSISSGDLRLKAVKLIKH